MELKIANLYDFYYESKSARKREYDNPIKVRLRADVIADLVNEITEEAVVLQESFDDRLETLQPYFDAIDTRDVLADARKAEDGRRKSDDEKEADAEVAKLKAKFFPAQNRDYVYEKVAEDFFYRVYSPDNMDFEEYEPNTRALLVNKSVTANGKIVHRFITLNPVTIEQADFDALSTDEQNALEIV